MDGLVVEVVVQTQGSETTAAAAVNATSVPVEDLTDFLDGAGRVRIGEDSYDWTGVDDSTVDAEGSGGLLLLASPGLTEAVEEFTPVEVLAGEEPAVDFYAEVVDPEADEDAEPILAHLVSREERLAWPVGAYDPPVGVSLFIDEKGRWRIGEVHGIGASGISPDVLDRPRLAEIIGEDAPAGTGSGQTVSTEPPPSGTDHGYAEDHFWWQVVDGERLGTWSVSAAGTFDVVEVVSADSLVGKTIRTAISGRRIVIVGDDGSIPGDAQEIRFYDEADGFAARVWVTGSDTGQVFILEADKWLSLLSDGVASLVAGGGDARVSSISGSAYLFSGTGPSGGLSTTHAAVAAQEDGVVRLSSDSGVFGSSLVSLLVASTETTMGGPVGVSLAAEASGSPVPITFPQSLQRGVVSSGTLVANTVKDVTVTFATEFDVAPTVTISLTGVSNPLNFGVVTADITTTGFTARFIRSSGTAAITAHWSAGPAD